MVKCKKCLIEAHLVKITAEKRLPKPRGKGTGAEVERRGGRFAGSSDNTRSVVALSLLLRRAIQYLSTPSGCIGSLSAAAFFVIQL